MKNLIVKALLVAVLVCSAFRGSFANEHDTAKALQCQPVAAILAQLDAAKAQAFAVLEGEDLDRAIRLVRESGVEGTDLRWTISIVAVLADGSLLVVVGNDGKICAGIRAPAEHALSILKTIFGVQV